MRVLHTVRVTCTVKCTVFLVISFYSSSRCRAVAAPLYALNMFHLLLFVIFWTVNAVAASSPSSTPRVAVVGCGVGGSAASFYLQDLFKNNSLPAASITAFEATGRIGGRLKHISFGKQQATIEVGGAAWTSSNQFVKELARRVMNISKINDTNLRKLEALSNRRSKSWCLEG